MIAAVAFMAAHCAANRPRNAASSADSCGLVVEPLIATSK